eukprot:TRINITY_DN27763_c0_g1_i1.p1 TRINITY_DN27763_c0_g1~~TRINITY_DN27763_c0_g1_i1.p1  ORF type:complete len:268 (+),score=80.22 TRINITY_DN27763_c0_g1_i1:97-900(+)
MDVGKWWSGGGLGKVVQQVKQAGKQITTAAEKVGESVSEAASKASGNVSETFKSAKASNTYATIRRNVGSAVDALGDLATTAGVGNPLADPAPIPVPHKRPLVLPGDGDDVEAILAAFPDPPVDRYSPYRAVIHRLADEEPPPSVADAAVGDRPTAEDAPAAEGCKEGVAATALPPSVDTVEDDTRDAVDAEATASAPAASGAARGEEGEAAPPAPSAGAAEEEEEETSAADEVPCETQADAPNRSGASPAAAPDDDFWKEFFQDDD